MKKKWPLLESMRLREPGKRRKCFVWRAKATCSWVRPRRRLAPASALANLRLGFPKGMAPSEKGPRAPRPRTSELLSWLMPGIEGIPVSKFTPSGVFCLRF